MAVQIHQDFGMCINSEHSPSESPLSASPSPEQRHSPRGNNGMAQEQSLHIIVEPQINGQTNMIYLINPPTGEIISSMLADHGSYIEIQPGVWFRVPFPHEHQPYQTGIPMQQQHQPALPPQNFHPTYSLNVSSQNMQNSNLIPDNYNIQEFINPHCPMHGNQNYNTYLQTGNERADKKREKLQKKLRDKNNCICKHDDYGGRFISEKKAYNHEGALISEQNGHEHHLQTEGMEEEKDLAICVPPNTMAESPYAIIVTWEQCISNNSHLHNCSFDLQMSESRNTKYKTIFSGQSNTFRACQLQPGTEYSFRLCALWNNKRGPFSDAVSCATCITQPDQPSMLRVIQKTKTAITLKWNAPANDGGSKIISYTLQGQKDDEKYTDLYTGLQKQHKHSHKLAPGTSCVFRILATNEIGNSDWSAVLRCLTSSGPPSVPEKPGLVDSGTNFIRLKWSEPENNGAPIQGYKLEMEDPNNDYGFIVKYNGEGMSYCCQNLRRNTHYSFRLSASNSQGYSRYSVPVSYMTLPEAPGRMEKPKLNGKPRTSMIALKWDPPRDSGGNEISTYILEVDDGKGGSFNPVHQGPEKEYMVSNLNPGCTYRLRVASESRAGKGAWSPVISATTLPVCPTNCVPPRCVKADPNDLFIEWDQPQDNGGAPISNYIVNMTSSLQEEEFKQVYTGCKQACCVSGLLPGKEYYFKLQASNQAGTSSWSPISMLTTAPSGPDAPDIPVVSFKTPTNLRLDWAEPLLHGAEVTSYCVERLENDAFQKVYQGPCCYCEIKRNLNPASYYYFRLQALSSAGSSPYSNVFTVETPPSTPGAVTEIKVIEQTSSSCLVQWRHPIEHGSRVSEYILEATGATSMICTAVRPNPSSLDPNSSLDGSSSRSDRSDLGSTVDGESDAELLEESDCEAVATESINGSETSSSTTSKHFDDTMEYRLTGLTADAAYKLRIQAVNSIGTGPFSHPIQFFTKELPPQPPTLNASAVSYHSIKLKWGDSSMKKSLAILNHNLQVQSKSGNFSPVYNGMGTSYTMSKLNELSSYCCRIRSKNDAGEGEFSKSKIFHTKAQPPSVIKDLKFKEVTATSMKLAWSPSEKVLRDDDVVEYRVQMFDQENSKDCQQVYSGGRPDCYIGNLKPESNYQFRVHAVRFLSESAQASVPSTSAEVKGVFCPLLRVKTMSEKAVEERVESEQSESVAEVDSQKCKLTDTHLALIILGTFLLICAVIAGAMRWVMGDLQV